MSTRINIAEILQNCSKGTELDSPCFDNVVFDRIDDKGRIRCLCGDIRDEVSFTAYGCLNESPSAKCVLFPKGKKGWESLVKKFDITTLKPFDRVLTRDGNSEYWRPTLYGFYQQFRPFHFACAAGSWFQCIPYEGNEHLLGTTDNCNEYYKTWEDLS